MSRRDRRGEVGYWTAPEARGRGVAVRTTVLMVLFSLLPGDLPG